MKNNAMFVLISLALWLAIFIYWVIRSRDRGILNEIAGLLKLFLSGFILHIPAFFGIHLLSYSTPLPAMIAGLFLLFSGFVFCTAAREYLAHNWSGKVALQENHKLINSGPYKIVRHPVYSGVLAMMAGTGIIIGNAFGFLWILFCFCGLFRKSRQEEELLEKEFGEAYGQYKKETKMIIPCVLGVFR